MVKCLFVHRDNGHESLGIEYLSSVLKKAGHETDLIIISDYEEKKSLQKRLIERIENFKPDFICFSIMTDDYLWACNLSEFIKGIKNIPVIFGGPHITACPEEVIKNKSIDYVVIGEGEETIVELVENPKKTNIKNTWLKKNGKIIKNKLRPLIQNLDSLPFPDKELFFKEAPYLKGETYYFMTSRGCPFGYTYCFNNYLKKLYHGDKWLRKRSVKSVIDELKETRKKFNYHIIFFGDDCFTFDKQWLRDFFKEYKKEINIPFKMLAHPHFMDKEIVSILKEGGCFKSQIGVQTPIERVRKEICKRSDTNELIAKVVAELKKQKIYVHVDHLYGLPGQTTEELEKGIEFYIDLKPDVISQYWMQYYPSSEIINIAKNYNMIDDNFEKDIINKGKIRSSEIPELSKKADEKLAAISRFMCWIPFLPRPISRYLLRSGLYLDIFRTDKMNKIPLVIKHLGSLELMRAAYKSMKRKRDLENHYLKLNQQYK
ncbi:MAG: radical SAM protein [Nanoarchaeota archaeon]